MRSGMHCAFLCVMTQREAKQAVQALGLVLRYSVEYAEYRVDYRPDDTRRSADSAYFTTDRQDAVDTARHMAGWQKDGAR